MSGRIPLHDHSGPNSGGIIKGPTVVTVLGGQGGSTGSGSGTSTTVTTVYPPANEVYYSLGTLGTAATVDVNNGTYQYGTLGTATTLSFTGANAAYADSFTLELAQDGTGGRTVTWPASVQGTAALSTGLGTAASSVTLFVFSTRDGGTTWYGYTAGGGSSSPTGSAGGDLSGTYPNPTVSKINGSPLGTLSPASADRLRWNGSAWVNSALAWTPLTVFNGTDWMLLVDGSGNAIMTEV